MKIMTIAGTRPELIRLSRIIPALDEVCQHVFVWTGQNYDPNLSDLFFEELGVRAPDKVVFTPDMRFASAMDWIGSLIGCMVPVLKSHAPDKVLILGDTNSAMSAYVAKRMGIPVYHMEAGNRCYDDRVPEEVNRRVVDACSTVLMPYTSGARDNLLAEGYPSQRIFVTGNPIQEVLDHYRKQRRESDVLERLGLTERKFILATTHRAENVDDPERLQKIAEAFYCCAKQFEMPVIVSTHPRTRSRLEAKPAIKGSILTQEVRWLEPMGFHDFTRLEQDAALVITDSGTCQEEACLFHVPAVTIRETTERPETIACGSNVVAGVEPLEVVAAAASFLKREHVGWPVPAEYLEPAWSQNVVRILLSKGVAR
jgi:UDP-N-acetylglucosamine 2-epimerase (non-hydrolysing)